jgi:hypothetical protein
MSIEIFPPELLTKDKEKEVVIFLQKLPVPARRKKEALVDWCKFVGAALTEELVKDLLGPLAEEARG